MPSRSLPLLALSLIVPITVAAQQSASSSSQLPRIANLCSTSLDSTAFADSLHEPVAMRPVPVPSPLRGLYVNRWAAIGRTVWELIDVAKRTEVNALVIDVKDDRGFTLYRSQVPLAHEIGADTVQPMTHARLRALLDTMRVNGILPIARIVVIKDPLLARAKTEWAIKRKSDGKPWLDKNGNPWLDPHQDGPWTYAAQLACEAVRLGFGEVQFDYVRFPDDKRLVREAEFPLAHGRERAQVIQEQLSSLRKRIAPFGVPVMADIFGLTTSDTTDMGIGQRWEMLIRSVDVVLPMMYPSHYAPGTYGIAKPNAHPYAVIDSGLKDAKHRSTGVTDAAEVIPWYQDFTLGPPHYGASQVRAQIKAGYDNGVLSWILWNPGSHYTLAALRREIDLAADTARSADSTVARRPDSATAGRTDSVTASRTDSATAGRADSTIVRRTDSTAVRRADSTAARHPDSAAVRHRQVRHRQARQRQ
ncbi:MAG TPA: putative glycoside hydrolase [Gemmatimonadaceae bacterium]|nr:putative glycoside hydrolase [Gemmatimonadaceae bacterium]